MARIRSIKPEFFSHELLASKSAHARLLAIGLLTLADCEGRLRWVPMQVHSQVFPWEASVNIEALLGELIDVSYVVHYEVDGKRYVEITNFKKHQRLTGKEASYESLIPAPPATRKKTGNSIKKGKHQSDSRGNIGNPLGTGEHRNIGTEEHRNSNDSSEPAKQTREPLPSECKFPVFPTSGKQKTWTATHQQLSEWSECYPGVDIDSEHRRAHVWIMANLDRRKTAKGMASFLVRWFSKQQNDSRQTKLFSTNAKPNSKRAELLEALGVTE